MRQRPGRRRSRDKRHRKKIRLCPFVLQIAALSSITNETAGSSGCSGKVRLWPKLRIWLPMTRVMSPALNLPVRHRNHPRDSDWLYVRKSDAIVSIECSVAAHDHVRLHSTNWPGRGGGQGSSVQTCTTNACVKRNDHETMLTQRNFALVLHSDHSHNTACYCNWQYKNKIDTLTHQQQC